MRRYSPKCLDAPAASKRRLDKEWSKRICHNGDALVRQGWILLIQHHYSSGWNGTCLRIEVFYSLRIASVLCPPKIPVLCLNILFFPARLVTDYSNLAPLVIER